MEGHASRLYYVIGHFIVVIVYVVDMFEICLRWLPVHSSAICSRYIWQLVLLDIILPGVVEWLAAQQYAHNERHTV